LIYQREHTFKLSIQKVKCVIQFGMDGSNFSLKGLLKSVREHSLSIQFIEVIILKNTHFNFKTLTLHIFTKIKECPLAFAFLKLRKKEMYLDKIK
jgi:hypothetical protein